MANMEYILCISKNKYKLKISHYFRNEFAIFFVCNSFILRHRNKGRRKLNKNISINLGF